MENKVICSKPFNTIYNHPGRNYAPCCWGIPMDDGPNNVLPIDYFNGEGLKRLRKEMLEGEMTDFIYSRCKVCFNKENDVGYSPRTQLMKVNDYLLSSFNSDGSLIQGTKNRFINISMNFFGQSCNLECYTCDPMESTTRKKRVDNIQENLNVIGITRDKISESHKYNENLYFDEKNKSQFDKIVDQLMAYVSNIRSIEIVGGEPMLMKNHFKLLDRIISVGHSKEIKLMYISNMTLMELDKIKYYFDNFKFVDIRWSVDALKERNNWIRYPTDWESTIKNVFEVQKYLNVTKKGKIIGSITPSLLGISTLRKTFNWLFVRDLTLKELSIFNNVNKPKFLRIRNLPNEIKELISNDVKLISPRHYEDLLKPRDQHEFELAIKYFDLLDKNRGTNWRSVFPEVAKYAN